MARFKLYTSLIFLLLFTLSVKENDADSILSIATDESTENAVPDSSFVVFDGTGYREGPDLTQFGLEPIHLIYPSRLWQEPTEELEGTTSLPLYTLVRKQAEVARQENDEIAVIDIEHWPVKGEPATVSRSVALYLNVLKSFQESTPDVKYGYYRIPPVPDYWNAIQDPSSSRYQEWEERNRRLDELADQVDVFFPSLYTFYQDRERWVRYAIANIEQTRKYNGDKPVYVFLWPQYHTYNEDIGGQFIDPEFWKIQLQTARKYADGIVIWTPSSLEWDDDAEWWKVTKAFMSELNGENS